MELVIASKNMHKVRELKQLLKQSYKDFDLLSLADFPDYAPPLETETTFEGNAKHKALHAAKTLQKLVLADDSGLIVPALGDKPGVFSARYAGPHATDLENRLKLLADMSDLQDIDRSAYFECALALASAEGIIATVKGTCEGTILSEERGRGGFGYDALFQKYEYSKTFAELDEEIKNRVSHRRKAFDRLCLFLDALTEDALLDRRI